MREIPLTQGQTTLVDDEDYGWLVGMGPWHAQRSRSTFYATFSQRNLGMHRVIVGVTDPKDQVDHEDNDGLNNRRYNLRVATHAQNQRNRGKQANNKSGYKGVYWDYRSNKWRAEIRVNGKRIFLGRFDDVLDAAAAYHEAAIKYHGEFAHLHGQLIH